jgi:hypothetical protein
MDLCWAQIPDLVPLYLVYPNPEDDYLSDHRCSHPLPELRNGTVSITIGRHAPRRSFVRLGKTGSRSTWRRRVE